MRAGDAEGRSATGGSMRIPVWVTSTLAAATQRAVSTQAPNASRPMAC